MVGEVGQSYPEPAPISALSASSFGTEPLVSNAHTCYATSHPLVLFIFSLSVSLQSFAMISGSLPGTWWWQ